MAKEFTLSDVPPVPEAPIPRWSYENYKGDFEDMVSDIFGTIFWSNVAKQTKRGPGGKPERKPAEMPLDVWYAQLLMSDPDEGSRQNTMARQAAEAFMDAAQAAYDLKDKADRSFMFYLYEVKRQDRYRRSNQEYETFEEFLLDRIPDLKDRPGERSDIMYLMNNMLPLMAQVGKDEPSMAPGELLKHKDNIAKVRAAVPHMRNIEKRYDSKNSAFDKDIAQQTKDLEKVNDRLAKAIQNGAPEKTVKEIKGIVEEGTESLKATKLLQQVLQRDAEKEFIESINETFSVLGDPTVPAHGPNGVGKVLERSGDKVRYEAMVSQGKDFVGFYLVVDPEYQKAVESALRHFVDFANVDYIRIHEKLKKDFKIKEK